MHNEQYANEANMFLCQMLCSSLCLDSIAHATDYFTCKRPYNTLKIAYLAHRPSCGRRYMSPLYRIPGSTSNSQNPTRKAFSWSAWDAFLEALKINRQADFTLRPTILSKGACVLPLTEQWARQWLGGLSLAILSPECYKIWYNK